MLFINFIGQTLDAATYIEPGAAMSKFVQRVKPEELGPEAPWSWQLEDAAVRTKGAWWSEFRRKAIEFKAVHHEGYLNFPSWDTI